MARADPDSGEGQILGLHVLPSEWGQRIGSALRDAALAVLSTVGYTTAGLWVIAANQRARRMYENRGWVLRPGVEQDVYGVIEVRYRRELQVSAQDNTQISEQHHNTQISEQHPALTKRLTQHQYKRGTWPVTVRAAG